MLIKISRTKNKTKVIAKTEMDGGQSQSPDSTEFNLYDVLFV